MGVSVGFRRGYPGGTDDVTMRSRVVVPLTIAITAATLATGNSHAIEYIDAELPTADSAEALYGPLAYAFRSRPKLLRKGLTSWKESLEESAPFWRDATFDFDMRTFSFDRSVSSTDQREAWAVGGRLTYETGRWHNFSILAAYYNSTKLSASGGDTGVLAPGQKNISIIGEANLRYEFDATPLKGSVMRLYRQTLDAPFINTADIRLLPSTHEGYTISRRDSELDFFVGHITKVKRWDSDEFVYMSEAAGADGTDKGVTSFGGKLPSIGGKLSFGAGIHYGWDTFNTFITEGSYHTVLRGGLDMRLSAQFTDQRSVGDELVGDFTTNHAAARAAFGWRGAVLKIAGSITSDNAGIRKPWGGSPSYLALMRGDFDRANERAFLVGLSFNSERFADLGLSGFANVAWGSDAKDPATGAPLPDRTEYDVTVDWKPPRLPLKGLWIRVRYGLVDDEGDGETNRDIRLILNYQFEFI
jgi:outer membrane porin, OprD family